MQILVFRLKDLYYGVSTDYVNEITKTHPITPIPKSEEWVEGLINLRGEVLTLVNLYSILNINAFNKEACYNNTIIAQVDNNNVALMVDEVIGVTDVAEEELQSTSEPNNSAIYALVTLYDQIVNVLELNSLFKEKEE